MTRFKKFEKEILKKMSSAQKGLILFIPNKLSGSMHVEEEDRKFHSHSCGVSGTTGRGKKRKKDILSLLLPYMQITNSLDRKREPVQSSKYGGNTVYFA